MLKRSKIWGIWIEVKRKMLFSYFLIFFKFNYFIVLYFFLYMKKLFVEIDRDFSNEIICFEYLNEKVLNIFDYYFNI